MKKSKELSTQNGSIKYELINKFWYEEIKIYTEMLTHVPELNDFFEFCYRIQNQFLLSAAKLGQDVNIRSAIIELQKKC